jgi:hypothetical protein
MTVSQLTEGSSETYDNDTTQIKSFKYKESKSDLAFRTCFQIGELRSKQCSKHNAPVSEH